MTIQEKIKLIKSLIELLQDDENKNIEIPKPVEKINKLFDVNSIKNCKPIKKRIRRNRNKIKDARQALIEDINLIKVVNNIRHDKILESVGFGRNYISQMKRNKAGSKLFAEKLCHFYQLQWNKKYDILPNARSNSKIKPMTSGDENN